MSLIIGTICSSLQRAFWSWKFLLCVVFSVLLLCIGIGSSQEIVRSDVITLVSIGGMSAASLILVCVIPIIPYGTSYAEEWQDGACKYWMIRCGVQKYIIGKTIAAFLSGFFVLFCSIMISILLLSIWLPLSRENSLENAYSIFINQGKPILYLLFYSLHVSCSAALFPVVGLWISTYIPYQFTAMTFPIMIYVFSLRFVPVLGEEINVLWTNLVDTIYDMGAPIRSLIVKYVTVLILVIILEMDTERRVEKMVKNG